MVPIERAGNTNRQIEAVFMALILFDNEVSLFRRMKVSYFGISFMN